jgi:class 3 adenylate cyclase
MKGLSLRFNDPQLEADYQRVGGREGRIGYVITSGAAAVLWAIAAVLLPDALAQTMLAGFDPVPAAVTMATASAAVALLVPWATTLDRQHGALAILTSANGLVIIGMAAATGFFPGYAVSAVMLLFAFGFVSRTGYPFALLRTAIITVGFGAIVLTYPANVTLDVFIFVAAVAGTLIALRMIERSRRRVFYQQRLIVAQAAELEREKDKSDRLLLNVLPASIVPRLRDGETTIADDYAQVTVLFADVVGFTALASRYPATQMVQLLDEIFTTFDRLASERGVEKIKTIGDAYMAAAGLLDPDGDHAQRVVDLGLAMQEQVAAGQADWHGIRLRVGIHTGPAAGGVIGRDRFSFDLWGDTINVAARLEQHGLPGRIHISAETWQLVRDQFACQLRGDTDLRGVGQRQTYLVEGRQAVAHALPAQASASSGEPMPDPRPDGTDPLPAQA